MKRFLVGTALAALLGFTQPPARAALLSGFLGQCAAVTAGVCTEPTSTTYARQPISFGNLRPDGSSVSTLPYNFSAGTVGQLAGRAVFDAVAGGNQLVLLPTASALSLPSIGDRAEPGALSVKLTGAAGNTSDSLNTTIQAGATFGTTPDGSLVTASVPIKVEHGQGFPFYGSADPTTSSVTQVTGFAYAAPAGVSAINIKGAGTLAAGTITLPTPMIDGYMVKLYCSVTVTALTLTATAPATFVGAAPTTCGPAASHQLQYFAADATWHVLT